MTKNNSITAMAKETTDEELEIWAKFIGIDALPEGGEEQIDELASRLVSLGDMTAVANYLVELGKEDVKRYISMLVEQVSVTSFILSDKLGVTQEEMKEYTERYYRELEEAKEMMAKAQEEAKEKEEEKEVKPTSKAPCEL